MNVPDIINGAFTGAGGLAVGLSVARLLKDKRVAGFHWGQITFFTVRGLWNVYYYPLLGQWWSLVGGLLVVAVNLVYLALYAYYSSRETENAPHPVRNSSPCPAPSAPSTQGE